MAFPIKLRPQNSKFEPSQALGLPGVRRYNTTKRSQAILARNDGQSIRYRCHYRPTKALLSTNLGVQYSQILQGARASDSSRASTRHDIREKKTQYRLLTLWENYPISGWDHRRETLSGTSVKWLRGPDLNRQPFGYEPNELPLLHPAKNFRLGSFMLSFIGGQTFEAKCGGLTSLNTFVLELFNWGCQPSTPKFFRIIQLSKTPNQRRENFTTTARVCQVFL